jgi:hypothetical protein
MGQHYPILGRVAQEDALLRFLGGNACLPDTLNHSI